MLRLWRALILFVVLFPAVTVYAEPPKQQLLIGLIPAMNVFKQVKKYKPLIQYLAQKTGTEITLTMLNRYGNVVDSFESKGMDGAFFGSLTGVLAHDRLGVETVARPVGLDGRSTYHGLIIVRKDSKIRKVQDMRGKVMAFIDRANACGYVYPLAYFKEHGVDNIDTFFRDYYFAGSHDAIIDAVLERDADVGVTKDSIFKLKSRNDPMIARHLMVLDLSPEFPKSGLFLRESLNNDIKKKIKDTLLNMDKDPQGREVLRNFGALRFVETDMHRDYKTVFDLAEKAGIDIHTYDYLEE